MKSFHLPGFLVGATMTAVMLLGGVARAQTTISISMTATPDTPRLQGPFTFSAVPSSPFLFAVPATGLGPLTFSASGLPAGLSLAPATGIISGSTPSAGSYPVEITVSNSSGSASATYTLVSGNTLSLTPPMGWNSYDSFGASVTEGDMDEQAQAVRKHLQPFGWDTVVIDYRWYEPGEPIDANGRYLPVTSKYPSATGSNGFKALADRIHALGLRFGIHIMRGVPRKSYDADLPIAGSNYTTKDAGDPNSPCPWDTHMWGVRGDTAAGKAWYDALFQQYADFGVDFVKIDDMLNNNTKVYHQAEADAIRAAVEKTGRSIVLSFSPGPDDPSWLPNSVDNLNANASMWRVVNDFWDYNALTDLEGVFEAASTWQGVDGLIPGHWPDLDMLPLGYLGPRNEWHASGQTTFTRNEQVSIMTLWTMLPSPLMYGGNPAELNDDPWTLALLTNEEVLSVHQDTLGARGRRTAVDHGEIWVRDLSGGRKAVAFFNREAEDAMFSASFEEIGVSGALVIRDLWRRADVESENGNLSANVPGGAALLYTLSPPAVDGAGGTSGTSGAGGASGAANGGASGAVSAGAGGVAGTSGVAGAAGASGGSAGSGGTGGVDAPLGGAAAHSTKTGAGCGCAIPGHRHDPAALLLVAAGATLGARRRRRR